jgi:hypothetical protein
VGRIFVKEGRLVSKSETSPTTDTTPEKTDSSAPSYPLCIFASASELPEARITKEFHDEGLELLFVKDANELYAALERPEAFMVFVDVGFCGGGVKIIHARDPKLRAFVVFMAGRLSTQQSSALFGLGASDILTHPVHPVMFKSRAKMMLARFLKIHDLPEHVVLPDGMTRRQRSSQIPLGESGERNDSFKIVKGEAWSSRWIRHSGEASREEVAEILARIAPELKSLSPMLFELRTDVAWQSQNWSAQSIPSPYRVGNTLPVSPAALRSLDEIAVELTRFFHACCQTLEAQRMLFFSLRPNLSEMSEPWSFPERIYLIGSSDGSIPLEENEKSLLFPQIRVAFEKQRPLYLAAPLPELVADQERKLSFKLNGANEASSAVFPVIYADRFIGVLYVQFSRACDDKTRALLEEAVSYFQIPQQDYLLVDFLARVYRYKL